MATERGYYEINPEPPRRVSNPDASVIFKGSGDATLTVYGFESWKEFLKRGDRLLTEAEIERIEAAASVENFSIGGRIAVEWPEVEINFAMDQFIGRKKKKTPFIVTVRQNFATIMHPFTITKPWMRFLGDKDSIRLNGYEWVFEQDKEHFSEYKGHIRCGKDLFITFQFSANFQYHYNHP